MPTRPLCANGEWYHCYNRGVDKRVVFNEKEDYERFLGLLYLSNGTGSLRISDLRLSSIEEVFDIAPEKRGDALVEIGAYALMPNHVHLVIKQVKDNGIPLFMQKIFTGYTMFFNKKNERVGALFSGTYKAKHVSDDRYLKQVVPYVLMNPVELFEPKWKEGRGNIRLIKQKMLRYPYTNLQEIVKKSNRPEAKISSSSVLDLYDAPPSMSEILREAREYYRSLSKVKP